MRILLLGIFLPSIAFAQMPWQQQQQPINPNIYSQMGAARDLGQYDASNVSAYNERTNSYNDYNTTNGVNQYSSGVVCHDDGYTRECITK